MKVKELKEILNNFSDELEVMTKKTTLFGNVGYVNNVKQDTYEVCIRGSFDFEFPCVLLTDELKGEE